MKTFRMILRNFTRNELFDEGEFAIASAGEMASSSCTWRKRIRIDLSLIVLSKNVGTNDWWKACRSRSTSLGRSRIYDRTIDSRKFEVQSLGVLSSCFICVCREIIHVNYYGRMVEKMKLKMICWNQLIVPVEWMHMMRRNVNVEHVKHIFFLHNSITIPNNMKKLGDGIRKSITTIYEVNLFFQSSQWNQRNLPFVFSSVSTCSYVFRRSGTDRLYKGSMIWN